jgi:hypothetical protein
VGAISAIVLYDPPSEEFKIKRKIPLSGGRFKSFLVALISAHFG